MTDVLPVAIYWLDTHQRYVDVNNQFFQAIGADFNKEYIIGKTPLDIYPEAMARNIMDHHSDVVRSGVVFRGEEAIVDITTGNVTYFDAIVGPLYDEDGHIIGTIGTSIDITLQKEAKERDIAAQNEKVRHLRLENELHQTIIEQQNRFREIVLKVAHDINSPLAALNMMLDVCNELPEDKRSFLRRATESILDIANNLLTHNDGKEESGTNAEIEFRQPLLVSDLLVQLLSEKKVQYQERPITFETTIANNAQFAFIQVQKTEFRRALSNLINNAVDALIDKEVGAVTLYLTANDDSVVVKVADNGVGMPREKVEKILAQQGFTEGKENGHGLGLQQVWDMLECNHGTMAVQSNPGKGSSIQLTFSRIAAADWIAQDIRLVPESIIVVLDDDESIHHAWDLRFQTFLECYPSLRVCHFTQGKDALDFLDKLSAQEKKHVVFLSDYELLHQPRNGLQIIEASQIAGAMLVTSYYANPRIRDAAMQLSVKILPKQMAAIIPVDIE